MSVKVLTMGRIMCGSKRSLLLRRFHPFLLLLSYNVDPQISHIHTHTHTNSYVQLQVWNPETFHTIYITLSNNTIDISLHPHLHAHTYMHTDSRTRRYTQTNTHTHTVQGRPQVIIAPPHLPRTVTVITGMTVSSSVIQIYPHGKETTQMFLSLV